MVFMKKKDKKRQKRKERRRKETKTTERLKEVVIKRHNRKIKFTW